MNMRRLLAQRFLFTAVIFAGIFYFNQSRLIAATTDAQIDRITYRLRMPRPVSHLFHVSIEIESDAGIKADYIDFQMPLWSPGRYAVFDFAKNVQEFQASLECAQGLTCASGYPEITRRDTQTWRVDTRGAQSITVSYKVFGNDLSGTFSQLDDRHACFNGGSVFMYVVDHKQNPVSLEIEPPPQWRIVNGSTTEKDQQFWRFPNYDILIDTPTEIGPDWTVDEFKVEGKTYRVVVHSLGKEGGKRPALVRDIEKIVRAQVAMWGPPEFDTYTFLLHFAADDVSGDGMEHLNSTNIIESGALGDPDIYEETLDGVSHEFFHVWNVKRLRPAEFGPWDFTRPANTRGLWIAEGLTNYYGQLMQRRAGTWDDRQLLSTLSKYVTSIENSPASRLMSAEDSSLSAPFLDGGTHAQKTNLANTSVSYYSKGEVLGIVLDLLIRSKTGGRASLDDVMRRLYRELYLESPNASYYLRGRGYTSADFERVVSDVAGTDMKDFFRRYVSGVETPPYDEALAFVGLHLSRLPTGTPYTAGITAESSAGGAHISNVYNDSAAEDAGLQEGDVITAIAGRKVTGETWLTILNRYKQGAKIPMTIKRDRRTLNVTVTLGPPDDFEYRIEDLKTVTPEMRAQRVKWMNGK